jgi:hypothetical protein
MSVVRAIAPTTVTEHLSGSVHSMRTRTYNVKGIHWLQGAGGMLLPLPLTVSQHHIRRCGN